MLRTARSQIHQGVGALELVGLPAAAIVLRASETAIQRSIAKPQSLTPELVADLEHASFGLLDYLSRLLAGKQVSSLSLFPAYRAVQEAVEAERVHPADLWAIDWRWREVANDPDVVPRQADATVRAEFEGHLLSLMRGTQTLTAAAQDERDLRRPRRRLGASAGAHLLEPRRGDVRGAAPRPARLRRLHQARRLAPAGAVPAAAARRLRRLRAARPRHPLLLRPVRAGRPRHPRAAPDAPCATAYGFVEQTPTDYSHSVLGRFDPAIVAHAKKRVAAAKEAWSATAGGEMHRLAGLSEQFALVGDSLRRLFPFGESFAAELQTAVAADPGSRRRRRRRRWRWRSRPACSISRPRSRTATSTSPSTPSASSASASGSSLVRQKQPPEPLEPWMEELYRRVSDRQTMGSVVQELRASLSEVEKSIDKFFRNPGDHAVLHEVPVQLSSMRGVLSVLGMDPASQALLRMRDEVDGLVSTEVDPEKVQVGRRLRAPGRQPVARSAS